MKMSHIDEKGNARMVDVSSKEATSRTAIASGCIKLGRNASDAIDENYTPKGDVFSTARIGSIAAVKRTWELIPLCHPLRIGGVDIEFKKDGNKLEGDIQFPDEVEEFPEAFATQVFLQEDPLHLFSGFYRFNDGTDSENEVLFLFIHSNHPIVAGAALCWILPQVF